jgi:hypothetical protein
LSRKKNKLYNVRKMKNTHKGAYPKPLAHKSNNSHVHKIFVCQ